MERLALRSSGHRIAIFVIVWRVVGNAMKSVKVRQSGDASWSRLQLQFSLLSLIAFLGMPGCRPESSRRPIFGIVSVDGTPVARGSISFFPDRGHSGPAASTSISAGNYRFTTVSGPFAGPHRVVVGVETDPRGVTNPDASLSDNSTTAKRGPVAISTDRRGNKEPISPNPSRTQWESKADVPTANSQAAVETIDFTFQSELGLDRETIKEPQR